MITPSFALTATERVLPNLALDFTTASLDSRVTFTRTGNTATVINSSGYIAPINANLPRFDYSPVTLACNGLLIEEARTNVLANSLIDGTNLTTQVVTTTAVAYTLSFYGTGNIVLSGTSSSTQTGSGVYPSRKTYTFTPTAGVLTLTVSGVVQYAQLEAGAFSTSFIPTTTATARNADVATMSSTNLSSWWNATEGALQMQYIRKSNAIAGKYPYAGIVLIDSANRFDMYQNSTVGESVLIKQAGATSFTADFSLVAGNTVTKTVLAYKQNSFAGSVNATTVQTSVSGNVPSVSIFYIGAANSTGFELNGWVQKINYWKQRITNSETQAFSKT